jgi:hypothetical protein
MKDAEYRRAHKVLTPEFELAHAVIEAASMPGSLRSSLPRVWKPRNRPSRAWKAGGEDRPPRPWNVWRRRPALG